VLCWGDESAPKGRMMANTWQSEFPWQNLETDGWAGTSPIGSFRANGYGLFDMAGNVWEWTRDFFTPRHSAAPAKPCCARPARRAHPRKVIKGGSHLCAPTTASATAPPPGRARRSTPPPPTSASAASPGPDPAPGEAGI
jgi:formylglycine-generating enzyme required for sulfatase activity